VCFLSTFTWFEIIFRHNKGIPAKRSTLARCLFYYFISTNYHESTRYYLDIFYPGF
jgi:hypothetical protein